VNLPRIAVIAVLAASAVLHAQTAAPLPDRDVSFRKLPGEIWRDQKRLLSYPKYAFKPKPLAAAAVVVGISAALIATDARTAPHFHKTDSFNGFNSVMTGTATGIGIGVAPAALYVVGRIGKNRYAERTAILAGETLLDSVIVATALKDIARRERPNDYPVSQDRLSNSWGNGSGSYYKGVGGFPSQHAIAAFSVATVFSRRYGRRHRWVPFAAYGAASLVGFSRLTLSAHFASDVFVGGALGYAIGRFVVVR
jgi:hypothetical protein